MALKTSFALFTALFACACNGADTTPQPITPELRKTLERQQNFEVFFSSFQQAIVDQKLGQLQALTQFPLPVRGELDDSPTATLTENSFKPFMEALLAEPVYIEQNAELNAYTLAEVATKALTPPELDTNLAQWQGMTFRKTGLGWALTGIMTYDHLIEGNE